MRARGGRCGAAPFGLALALLAAALGPPGAAAAGRDQRPNILWIVVDDMSADFGCDGGPLPTPHVDRLAREGTRFARAYTTAPVCSPSRSALVTGRYQTAIGAHHHRSGRGALSIGLPPGVRPLPAILREAGYYTCSGDGLGPDGDGRLGKTDYNFRWEESIYDAADWSGRAPGQPFFMQVMLPGGKLRGESEESMRRLAARAEAELGSAVSPADVVLPPTCPDDPVLRLDRAAYLDAVRLTDAHVGRVLSRLEREGLLDDTVVVFLADHGISHARAKQFLYDEGTRIPLVVRGPGIPAGVVRDDLVAHIDVAALSLGRAGIVTPGWMQARDPFDPGGGRRDAVFAARDRCDETVDRIRSVRTDRWLYVRNFHPRRPLLQPNAYKDGKAIVRRLRALHEAGALPEFHERLLFAPEREAEELYDHQADPFQLANLAADPAHAGLLDDLRGRLGAWMASCGDGGGEPEAMYDSDMRVYVGQGNPEVERNIALMKRWAAEGK